MFEIAKNRFINLSKVVSANVYLKEGKWRVAVESDTLKEKETVNYSDAYETEKEARELVLSFGK